MIHQKISWWNDQPIYLHKKLAFFFILLLGRMACPVCCAGLFWHVLEQEIDWTVSAIYEERASSIVSTSFPQEKKKFYRPKWEIAKATSRSVLEFNELLFGVEFGAVVFFQVALLVLSPRWKFRTDCDFCWRQMYKFSTRLAVESSRSAHPTPPVPCVCVFPGGDSPK